MSSQTSKVVLRSHSDTYPIFLRRRAMKHQYSSVTVMGK